MFPTETKFESPKRGFKKNVWYTMQNYLRNCQSDV